MGDSTPTTEPRLTKEQASILGAFTGYACGPFSDIQEYAEKKFERPCWTHEFGDAQFAEKLKELARDDFLSLCHKTAINTTTEKHP